MLAAFVLAVLTPACASAAPKPFYQLDERQVARELKKIHKNNQTLESRVEAVSERFLGTPYKLGPLGEGEDGEFDRDPLIDLKRVDCTTFVEQVMAMALENDYDEVKQTLQHIRYKDGRIGFATRNHWTELDWVPQNVWAGYLRDITQQVAGEKVQHASKNISKRDWYAHMSTANIEGRFSESEKLKQLPRLQALGPPFEDKYATLSYLPMAELPQALPRIPSGVIANLVRADDPSKEVMVSHQILLVKKNGQTYVRHAPLGRALEDVPALEYFYRYFNSSWPLLGLNLNQARDPREITAQPQR